MKKFVGYVLALGLLVLGAFAPILFFERNILPEEVVSESTVISSYLADFTLAADGDLEVVETLTVEFPIYEDKRGIFRFFDRLDPTNPKARRVVQDVEVTRDGEDEPFEELTEDFGRYDVLKIGDADVILESGPHTYVIRYTVPGVIEPGENGSESQFYWNLIPQGWQQDITSATLTVHLPVPAEKVECGIGLGAETGNCQISGEDTLDLTITSGPIDDHTPVTLRVGLDLETPETGKTLPWTGRYDRVFGQSIALLGIVLALIVVASGFGLAMARRAFERKPQFPVLYAPPDGIGPAQGTYILNESTDRTAYVATLMHAAEQGAIDLTKAGDAWVITDKGGTEGWAGIDPVSTSIAHLLGGPGTTFVADPNSVSAGERLKTEISGFETQVKLWGRTSGNLVDVKFGGLLALLALAGIIGSIVLIIWNPMNMTLLALVPGAFGVFGATLLQTGASTKRTPQGRQLWSHIGGFKRILSTPSATDRFEFSGREELYTRYIPWAVALGVADEWAAKYRTEMGHEPPMPGYFGPYAGGYLGANAIGSMVDDFDSAVGSAISSYNATQSSSSSGGGGFSGGGGGGGGGGGSW